MAASHTEDIAHKQLSAAILPSSPSNPFSVHFGTISSTTSTPNIYLNNANNAHVHRRLANSAALGLGLTGLFLAIGLTAAWFGYFRAMVNPDARSGLGRDPLRRNRGSVPSSNQQGDDFEYEREEDTDDGASPPGGGMNRASESSDEGWAQQPPPPPAGLTDPENRYRSSAMTGDSSDIYGDTLGPKGSQRWDWVDRSNEEDDDDNGEDRNDQYSKAHAGRFDKLGGSRMRSTSRGIGCKAQHNVETSFSQPAPRMVLSSNHHLINDIATSNPKYWRGLSDKVAQKQNIERSDNNDMLAPIREDSDDHLSSPSVPSTSGLNESIDGLLRKYDIGTSIKDGFQQSLSFLRRPTVNNKTANANIGLGGEATSPLPDFKGAGGGDTRSTTTTSASSRSGPPMGGHRLQFSFDEESSGLYSSGGDDIESIDWEAHATDRMEVARKKSNSGDNINTSRGRRNERTRAPIIVGRV